MEGDGKVGELESGTLCKVDAHMWSCDSPSGLNKIHYSIGSKALLSLWCILFILIVFINLSFVY